MFTVRTVGYVSPRCAVVPCSVVGVCGNGMSDKQVKSLEMSCVTAYAWQTSVLQTRALLQCKEWSTWDQVASGSKSESHPRGANAYATLMLPLK
eukprot:1330958-Amphidinium_carterae.1